MRDACGCFCTAGIAVVALGRPCWKYERGLQSSEDGIGSAAVGIDIRGMAAGRAGGGGGFTAGDNVGQDEGFFGFW